MKVIGLTGSIGSGKSTVAAMLKNAHVPVIDADELARRVVLPNSPCLRQIVLRFGEGILLADKSLDRKKLGDLVFNDQEALADLEHIVHPAIEALRKSELADLQKQGHQVVVYMAPLLFEKKLENQVDKTIAVVASEEKQLERLMRRDNMREKDARLRLAIQMSAQEKMSKADEIIINDASLEDLFSQLQKVWMRLCNNELSKS